MDTVTKEKHSQIMAAIKSQWTKPEERVYDGLLDRHLLPDVHEDSLPGKPDFVFAKQRLAVFVEGCFWHKCPKHYRKPKSNKQFWLTKIINNVRRDERNRRKLRTKGFAVIRIWECATRGSRLENALGRVERVLAVSG